VEIRQSAEPGTYVRRSGEDVVAGQVVLPSGTRLGATRLAVAAAVGRGRVTIRRRPRLAVLSTGSELVEPGKPVTRGQIWDSNSYMLVAAATEAGMLAVRRTSLDDDPAAVLAAIEGLLDEVDVIVTSGGVSMGTRDVVKEVLTGRGTMRFEQVAMRPGKPQGFGMLDGRTPVFTLPGNPVSAYVSFQIFVAPALRRMQGLSVAANPVVTARLSGPVTSPAGLRHFLRGVLDDKSGTVRAVEGQGSHHLAALAGANALIVIDENATDVPAGAPVTVWRLPS
jgi:molybdopterin molybdotransferase